MDGSSFVEIRKSKFGKGLFATKNIKAHTIICTVNGPTLSFQQTIELGEKESHCIQIAPDNYILCNPPFLYSNHSCEPNCGLNAQLQLLTLHDVKQDQELFWDYSTSMLERHWTMFCFCNAASCRKKITDFDLLPLDLQMYYLQKNIVLPFIVTNMQTFSKAHIDHT